MKMNWNLDPLFPGGSQSAALREELQRTKHEVLDFKRKFKQVSDMKKGILHFQELEGKCRDFQEFVSCLLAQNVNDNEALQLQSQITQLCANCDALGEELNALLAELEEETFAALLADHEIQPISFHLKERRRSTKEKLPVIQESLVHQLSTDGYHGWNALYGEFIGNLRISSPISPEESLSVGQADNRLSHPDRAIRKKWFQRWEETWAANQKLIAQILNHLAGFRLNLYTARRWPSVLKEPLLCNRMQEETLNAMWQTVEEHKKPLHKYLACKAQILGLDKLSWVDVNAPLPFSSKTAIPYAEAAQLIIRTFTAFSPAMGAFAQKAFENDWIEAEDRPGKRPGGFCVSFAKNGESRIFMTYSGNMDNLFTLAHELGHAYHSHVVRELPVFARQYRMNVAETASTLAEMIVIDTMIKQMDEPKAKLALLDFKLHRAVIFLMNIHARFLFELEFYQARRKGYVLPEELSLLMEKAQKKAFGEALTEWHPHFWAAKLHFYATDVPFYNFPYTFGYLFSQGIYAHLNGKKEGPELYAGLLRDTGRLEVEELAERHLGVDLKQAAFWEKALQLIGKDVEAYLKLALDIKENG